jgi:hypothetical protein
MYSQRKTILPDNLIKKIEIEFTNDPDAIANEGVGDYYVDNQGIQHFRLYCKDNSEKWINYAYACLLHEITEQRLTDIRGIKEETIDKFDEWHLANNLPGEPGDFFTSPYRNEHRSAEMVERYFIEQSGIHWDDYNSEYITPKMGNEAK